MYYHIANEIFFFCFLWETYIMNLILYFIFFRVTPHLRVFFIRTTIFVYFLNAQIMFSATKVFVLFIILIKITENITT